jgi:hypothetical protein
MAKLRPSLKLKRPKSTPGKVRQQVPASQNIWAGEPDSPGLAIGRHNLSRFTLLPASLRKPTGDRVGYRGGSSS